MNQKHTNDTNGMDEMLTTKFEITPPPKAEPKPSAEPMASITYPETCQSNRTHQQTQPTQHDREQYQ